MQVAGKLEQLALSLMFMQLSPVFAAVVTVVVVATVAAISVVSMAAQ